MYRPRKIISGGQTGADMGGLLAARDLGIRTGGWAPKGWKTENGPNPDLKLFKLVQASTANYSYRTKMNVADADVVAIFGDMNSPGSKLTLACCVRDDVAYVINPTAKELRKFVEMNAAEVLMIAGNRESKCVGIEERVREIVRDAFSGC